MACCEFGSAVGFWLYTRPLVVAGLGLCLRFRRGNQASGVRWCYCLVCGAGAVLLACLDHAREVNALFVSIRVAVLANM